MPPKRAIAVDSDEDYKPGPSARKMAKKSGPKTSPYFQIFTRYGASGDSAKDVLTLAGACEIVQNSQDAKGPKGFHLAARLFVYLLQFIKAVIYPFLLAYEGNKTGKPVPTSAFGMPANARKEFDMLAHTLNKMKSHISDWEGYLLEENEAEANPHAQILATFINMTKKFGSSISKACEEKPRARARAARNLWGGGRASRDET